MCEQAGVDAQIVLRGLNVHDVFVVFGKTPLELGVPLTLLWKVGGGQYQGILVKDHPLLSHVGVIYKIWSRVFACQREVMLTTPDNAFKTQHVTMWDYLTSPSQHEHAEVVFYDPTGWNF